MPKHNKQGLALKAIKDNLDKSAVQISRDSGLPYHSIVTAARRNGIKLPKAVRHSFSRRSREMVEINGVKVARIRYDRIMSFKAMLPQLDYKERLNAEDMASRLGVTATTVRYWLHILKHRPQNHNGRTIYRHDKSGWPAIIDPMLKAGKPFGEVTKAIPGVCASSVYRWLANTGRIEVNEREIRKSVSPV